jgi:hypothetical protein
MRRVRDRHMDQDAENGHPIKRPPKPMPEDQIARPPNVLTGIIVPVIVLIVVLLLVMFPGTRLLSTCDNFTAIQLIYPLIFGALGATIGGSLRLTGPLAILGSNWKGVATGGIAAALLGFVITASIKPSSCAPRQVLWLKNFVVRYNTVTRDYVGNIDWSAPGVELVASEGQGSSNELKISRNLQLLFSGQDEFRIHLQFFRKADAAAFYQPVPSCQLEVRIGKPALAEDKLRFKLTTGAEHNEIYLKKGFFDGLEDELRKNPSRLTMDCLFGRGILDGEGSREIEKPINKLFVVTPAGWPISAFEPAEFWFVASAPKVQDARTSALGPEATEGEASAPVGTGPASLPTVVPRHRQLAAGCAPSDAHRVLIDNYLEGGNLSQNQRMELYGDWTSLHCYVWSFVQNSSAEISSSQRGRALRLTVYAIENSPVAGSYWQPQGDNKRDFSKDLPYLKPLDYSTIFDLVKSDDVFLRGEALYAIRCLPVDRLEMLFKAQLPSLGSLSAAQRDRLAIAASFMYYNRIVEWLDDDPVAKPSNAIISAEYDEANRWISADLLGKSRNSYAAMLLFAKGIVQRERELVPDLGKDTFAAMIKAVEAVEDSYPSNLRHIAQALAIARGGADTPDILSAIKNVDTYPSSTLLALNPQPVGKTDVFAGPDERFQKQTVNIDANQKAYLLLRKSDWYFGSGSGWVGWFHSSPKPS